MNIQNLSASNLPSTAYSLKLRDFLKGLLLAVVTPVLVAVQESLAAETLTLNWKKLAMVAIGALVAYLIKNYFSNETVSAVKVVKEAVAKKEDQEQ